VVEKARPKKGVPESEASVSIAMSFQSKAKKWIAVAQQLMSDRSKPVHCPFCDEANLKVTDVPLSPQMMERWITCPNCTEATALRMRNATNTENEP
jgi:transcription elongation factor Elf1